MRDPCDEVDKEKVSKATRLEALSEESLHMLKFILVVLSFLMILFLILAVVIPEKGIVLQPFECTGMNISSSFIGNRLCFNLQDIKRINEKDIENPQLQSRQMGNIPSIRLPANSFDYSITGLGNVGAGGTSLSLGHLILSLKQFIGRSSPKLLGSIQGSRSKLCIVAILNDPNIPGGIMAWEIEKNTSNSRCSMEDNILLMIEDLAFQMVNSLNNENKEIDSVEYSQAWVALKYLTIHMVIEDLAFQIADTLNNENKKIYSKEYPQTWEALKNLTLSRKAYLSYDATKNIKYLNDSRYFALEAMRSEPSYSKLAILFSILGSSYLELELKVFDREAENLFKDATKLDPSYAIAWDGLGLARLRQSKYQESIDALDQIDEKNRTANSWYNRGLAFYYLKRYDESIEAYNNSTRMDPANTDAWFNKGLSALEVPERVNESIEAFDKVTNLSPGDEEAWYNKGYAFYINHDYSSSIEAQRQATRLNSSYKEAWYNLGLSLERVKIYNDSIQAYCNATKLDKNYENAWEGIARVINKSNNCSGSILAFNKAIEPDLY